MASQINSFVIVYSAVYSGADQRKHQSSASLAFVWGIHRWPVISTHKWLVTWKMLPIDGVILSPLCHCWLKTMTHAVHPTKYPPLTHWRYCSHALSHQYVRGSCFVMGCCDLALNDFTMMTSSNGNIYRVTGPLCGEFTGPGEIPAQRPVTRSFDVFFDLRPNKRLSKQPWGLRRHRCHYDVNVMTQIPQGHFPTTRASGLLPRRWGSNPEKR